MPRLPLVIGLFALSSTVVVAGCRGEESEEAMRVAPWRADEVPEGRRAIDRSLKMIAARSQKLQFSVGSREHPLQGVVPLRSGFLELDPSALEHVRGELVFSLGGLQLLGEGGTMLPEETGSARRAVGLGQRVPDGERARLEDATFRILYGRDLSSRVVARGRKVGGEGTSHVRRVTATVEGELLLRGIEVHHRLRVQLDFRMSGDGAADGGVEELRVSLLGAEPVSLVEHEIWPRDSAGRQLAEQLQGFQQTLAKSAQVAGELVFVQRPNEPRAEE